MTIQTKATEQYFPVVLFIVLSKVVLTFESVDEILSVTFSVTSLLRYYIYMLYKVDLTFVFVSAILKCDHRAVLSCGTVDIFQLFFSWTTERRLYWSN